MSFGMLLVAFFCSPLYFMLRGRWVIAILHTLTYLTAIFTLMVFGLGLIPWLFGAAHALWDLSSVTRERDLRRQAEMIAGATRRASGA